MRLVDKTVDSESSFFKRITYTDGIYPSLSAELIQNPNRFFAFPLLGILVKVIILIPVFVEIILVGIWFLVVVFLVNPFVVLLTGKYWRHAYEVFLGLQRLSLKLWFYVYGLTDKYPGFSLVINDKFILDIPMPEKPNRFYAIPVFGGLARFIFLVPYFIFSNIISQAMGIGISLLAWAVVLFRGRYPEGIFELARDTSRVSISAGAYFSGLSDKYPSFYISMAHDKIKLILIAIAIILNGWNFVADFGTSYKEQPALEDVLSTPTPQLDTEAT